MPSPETRQPTPEESQQPQNPEYQEERRGQTETNERPLADIETEHAERRAAQEERTEQERSEHEGEEKTAEQMLEHEMMLETYDEMTNGLQGDAREVFGAVEATLSEQERVDLARFFEKFMDVSDREHAISLQSVHNIPRDELLTHMRANRGEYIQTCFQNSIDLILREAQNIEESAPRDEAERLGRAVNEKVNEAVREHITPAERAVWKKVKKTARSYVVTERERNPSRVFRGREKSAPRNNDSRSSDRLDTAANVYEVFNLVEEVHDAKEKGIDIAIRDKWGTELTDPEVIANTTPIRLHVATPDGLTSEDVKNAMGSGVQTIDQNDGRLVFEGDMWRMEAGVEKIQIALNEHEESQSA